MTGVKPRGEQTYHVTLCEEETEEEKNRKYPIGWSHKVNLIWSEKEQGTKKRAELALCLVIDLPDILHSGLEEHL